MLELNKKQQLEYVEKVTEMAQVIGYTVKQHVYVHLDAELPIKRAIIIIS